MDETISILHFNGQEKPWSGKDSKFGDLWLSFYEQRSIKLHNQANSADAKSRAAD